MRDATAAGATVMANYATFAKETANFEYLDLSREPDGSNTDTNLEDPDADGRTSSTDQVHFSTRAFRGSVSQRIADAFRRLTPTIFAQDVLSTEVDTLEGELDAHAGNVNLHLPALTGATAGQSVIVNAAGDGYELGDAAAEATPGLLNFSFNDATQSLLDAGMTFEGSVTEGSSFGGEEGVLLSDDSTQTLATIEWDLMTPQVQEAVDNRTSLRCRLNIPVPSGSFTDEPWQALFVFDFDAAPLTGTFAFERARYWLVFDSNTSGAGGAKLNGGFSTGANDIVFDGLSGRPLVGQDEWFDLEIIWPNGIAQDAEVLINSIKVADFTMSEQPASERNVRVNWTTGTVGGTNRRLLVQSASFLSDLATPSATNLPAAATRDEAQAGTEGGTRLWSPLRIGQAIAAQSPVKYEVLGTGSTIDLDAAPTETGLRHIRFGWGGVTMANLPSSMQDLAGQNWVVVDDVGSQATYVKREVFALNQQLSALRLRINGVWQDWEDSSIQRSVRSTFPDAAIAVDLDAAPSNFNQFRILQNSIDVVNPPSGASNTTNNFWIVQDLGFSESNGMRRLWQLTLNPPSAPSVRYWERARYGNVWGRWQESTNLHRSFRINAAATPPTATVVYLDPLSGTAFTDISGNQVSAAVAGTSVEQELTSISGNPGVWRRIDTNNFTYDAVDSTVTEAWRIVGATGQPAFIGAWAAWTSAPYTTVRFRRVGKTVEIQGLVTGGAAGTTGGNIFELPEGYRPSARLVKLGIATDGIARFDILDTGIVNLRAFLAGGANSYVSLDCTFGLD